MKRFCRVLPLVVLGLLLFTGVALAIGNPEFGVIVEDIFVFRDVLETGDQLYFVRYDVGYNATPDEDAEDTWQMVLYDSDDNVIAMRPLEYYFHNIRSIYLDSDDALTWEGSHKVRIMGMPSVFDNLTEGISMRTRVLAPGDYLEASELGDIMIDQAEILEADWVVTLLTTGDKLNTTGATYFLKAVPNLNGMVPDIFETTIRSMDIEYTPWDTDYEEELHGHLFTLNTTVPQINMTATMTDLSTMFGTTYGWGSFWIMGIAYLVVAGAIYAPTRNPGWAIIGAFPLIGGAAWIGMGTELLTFFLVLVFMVALIFAIFFILGRLT